MSEPIADYAEFMSFPSPIENPWDVNLVHGYVQAMGGTESVTQRDVDTIYFCYDQPSGYRSYHDEQHGGFVGQGHAPQTLRERVADNMDAEEVEAVLAIAGLFHDTAYKQVDAREGSDTGEGAWPPVLQELIGDVVRYERTVEGGAVVFRTFVTEVGETNGVVQMVADIFGVRSDGIAHNQGGNEFDSAVAAAVFLRAKGVAPKFIIAVVSAIAATVPFREAIGDDGQGNATDGYMGALAESVKDAHLDGYTPDWQDTNAIMQVSTHLANRDVAPFIRPDNVAEVVSNGRKVRKEEHPEQRVPVRTIRALARVAGLERSAPRLYEWFGRGGGPVSAANVPHLYILRDQDGVPQGMDTAYPPRPVHDQAVVHAEENSRLASLFFKAHEAGIALASSLAAMIGEPDAPVPGIVHARLWSQDTVPMGERFSQLNDEETLVFSALMFGAGQSEIGSSTPIHSPIAGMLFGALGTEGIEALSQHIQAIREQGKVERDQDPFSHRAIGQAYAVKVAELIGPDNFQMIIDELQRVARYYAGDPERGRVSREARLGAAAKTVLALAA